MSDRPDLIRRARDVVQWADNVHSSDYDPALVGLIGELVAALDAPLHTFAVVHVSHDYYDVCIATQTEPDWTIIASIQGRKAAIEHAAMLARLTGGTAT